MLTAPGFEVNVSGPGAAPSDPAPAPPGAAAALLAQLDGQPGSNGGATTIPTETTVASSGIAQAVQQGLLPAGLQTTTQQAPSVSSAVQLAQTQIQVTASQPFVQQSLSQAQTPVSPSSPPSPPPPPPPPPVSVTFAGIFKSTNGSGTTLGFVDPSFPARIPFTTATLVNNVLTVSSSALGGAGQLTIPLAPGTASFGSKRSRAEP